MCKHELIEDRELVCKICGEVIDRIIRPKGNPNYKIFCSKHRENSIQSRLNTFITNPPEFAHLTSYVYQLMNDFTETEKQLFKYRLVKALKKCPPCPKGARKSGIKKSAVIYTWIEFNRRSQKMELYEAFQKLPQPHHFTLAKYREMANLYQEDYPPYQRINPDVNLDIALQRFASNVDYERIPNISEDYWMKFRKLLVKFDNIRRHYYSGNPGNIAFYAACIYSFYMRQRPLHALFSFEELALIFGIKHYQIRDKFFKCVKLIREGKHH